MITFLFGSGADSDAADTLKSGQSFAEALLLETYNKEVKALLGPDFRKFTLIYPNSTKVFIQTVVSFYEDAKKVLEQNDIDNCINYYQNKQSVDYHKVIVPICQEWYRILHSETNNKTTQKIKEFFLDNAVLFDSLDEKFNSLRNIDFNDSAKRVINAYTTVFILMMHGLYDLTGFEWNYSNVFEKLNTSYTVPISADSYYSKLKGSGIECKIVTTNYTDLVEKETGRDDVTYLHGKMTWFEDLSDLSVYDCTDNQDRIHLLNNVKNIIPFILIPSGVKPLICTRQIKQFYKFIEKLDDSDELCVVGYKFNSEDNHINSIIAEWLRGGDNHRLVYFNYEDSLDFSNFDWANGLSEKIEIISINGDNAQKEFSKYLTRKR